MFIIDADWIPIVGQSLWDNWNVHINAKMSYAFFQIKLENSLHKISEYKSQAKKKKWFWLYFLYFLTFGLLS